MKYLISVFLLVVCTAVEAQPSEIRNLPGFVDFGELQSVYGEPKVRINIGGKLLRFVGQLAEEEDKEAADLLQKLSAVRVEVYKINDNTGPALDVLNKVSAQLEQQDWEVVVSVREDQEQTRIFIKLNEDVIGGLVVMVVNHSDEAVFINIIGEIDPAQVGRVTKALDIDVDI